MYLFELVFLFFSDIYQMVCLFLFVKLMTQLLKGCLLSNELF